jgi:HAD superfamily hydrolase (TIGR01509 family)
MLKAIIFDLDGTLVDSLPYHYESWSIFFKNNNLEETYFSKILKEYKGGGTLELMSSVFGNSYSKKELKKMSEDKEVIFRDIYKNNIRPIKGLINFLDNLKENNILLAIGSNATTKNVLMTIDELGITNYFSSIICGDKVSKGKPDPEMFITTLSNLKVSKDECIVFEDSIEGVAAAKKADIKVIGVTSSQSTEALESAGCFKTITDYCKIEFDDILDL